MAVRLTQNSRLRYATLISADGVEFFDLIEYPKIPSQPDDIKYTVKDLERIDRLANTFYGDPGLWWVIAVANQMQLLPSDLSANQVILIPSPTWVLANLFSKAKVR